MARKPRKQDWTPREPVSKKFLNAYLETAIWSSTDEEGRPLDKDYDVGDFSEAAYAQALSETNDFIRENETDLNTVGTLEQHGHDFWLSRNSHGAGFWDRGYGEVGIQLTRAAKAYGSIDVLVDTAGELYFA